MTDGEKMVWAAVFASKYTGKHEDLFEACEWAESAVQDLQLAATKCGEALGEGSHQHPIRVALRAMWR